MIFEEYSILDIFFDVLINRGSIQGSDVFTESRRVLQRVD
jgi:hypothetical protein